MHSSNVLVILTFTSAILLNATAFSATTENGAPNGVYAGYHRNPLLAVNGGFLGIERYFYNSRKRKIIGALSLEMQQKPHIRTTGGIIIGTGYRRVFKPGIFLGQGIKCGYHGTYFFVNTYRTTADGEIENIKEKLFSSILGGYYLETGYDFSVLTKLDAQFFVIYQFYLRYPNLSNIWIKHNMILGGGVSVHPKFLQRKKKWSASLPSERIR